MQCFATLFVIGTVFGFVSLCTTLIAVACSQFQKLNLALLDIRQKHVTIHHEEDDDQANTIASCDLNTLLNSCIQHHQEIKE